MEKSKLLLEEISQEQLEVINGGNLGLGMIWAEVAGTIWGSCSWPGGFYGNSSSSSNTTIGCGCTAR